MNFSSIQNFLETVLATAESAGNAGILLFIAVYAASAVVLLPASVLTLGAGAVYGPILGTAIVSVASTLGCTLAFLASRYVARPLAERRLQGNDKFQRIDRLIPERGAKLVFLMRLSPLIPFGILNYSCGLTQIELGKYVAASWAGMLPGTFAYVYFGAVGKQTFSAATGSISPIQLAVYGIGAVATIAIIREVSRVAREALNESGLND